jgi:carboxymethylenebutenolidase
MTDYERYVLNEHIEDFNDGIIGRRELLRRVTLITGSLAATMTVLDVMGCGSTPSGTAATPVTRTTSTPYPFATPPPSGDDSGITVQSNDPRIRVETIAVKGSDGADLISYAARPAGKVEGGILVVHENRGLVQHIRDVVRRVATAGFTGLSIDLLSRDGGADKLTDQAAYAAALAKRPVPDMVSDLMQALSALRATTGVGSKIGITGFCFGGGMVWNTLDAGAAVKAAVPFYGPKPADISGLASTKAAVFAIYAELDTAITGTKDQMAAALEQAKSKPGGQPYQIMVYPGVGHAFHNDTGARYNAVQAEAAWVATIEWFRKYVR